MAPRQPGRGIIIEFVMLGLRRVAAVSTQRLGLRLASTGTVKWFDKTKGFGFIYDAEDDVDVFVHQTNINMDGFRFLVEGQKVTFEVQNENGKQFATDVTPESPPEEW